MNYLIDDKTAADDFMEYIKSIPSVVPEVKDNIITFQGDTFEIVPRFKYILRRLKNGNIPKSSEHNNGDDNFDSSSVSTVSDLSDIDKLIFGKDHTENIVAGEIKDDILRLFKADGSIEERPAEYWITSNRVLGTDCERLEGNLFYKYKKTFTNAETFRKARNILYAKKANINMVYDPVEAYMMMHGITFFKGLKVSDVSVLSFDIETTGIAHNDDSRVLLISNTFRDRSGEVTRKLFALDEYDSDAEMIHDWCNWVREVDPSILIGHNIFSFDLPYLSYCYGGEDKDLPLGKDDSDIKYGKKPRKVRKDGSQSYDVFEAKIYGRQIIDTWILAMKSDVARKYDNYRLKYIVEFEGLKNKDRTDWDFEEIMPHEIWTKFQDGDVDMWEAFKTYCIEDSDDSLKLYDLMIPQFFYYNQSLAMPFQTMLFTATGRQLNGMLCRGALQRGHSIPHASEKVHYGGGISFGVPGVYKNVVKWDIKSMYPNIMIQYDVYDRDKDPDGTFIEIVKYFTKERFKNKDMFKETGDRYYDDLQAAGKIVVNSAYGLLGAPGLNYNSMTLADFVTRTGREIIHKTIIWATGKDIDHWTGEK